MSGVWFPGCDDIGTGGALVSLALVGGDGAWLFPVGGKGGGGPLVGRALTGGDGQPCSALLLERGVEDVGLSLKWKVGGELSPSTCSLVLSASLFVLLTLFFSFMLCISAMRLPWIPPPNGADVGGAFSETGRSDAFFNRTDPIPAKRSFDELAAGVRGDEVSC